MNGVSPWVQPAGDDHLTGQRTRDFLFQMANGRWQMANGKQAVTSGHSQRANGHYPLPAEGQSACFTKASTSAIAWPMVSRRQSVRAVSRARVSLFAR